ncbi:centrosomal protein of 55 kDa-like isoform X2 [Portunus trituberculatus]|uniref:centrosomal protein of 55 kDa-like isoform X2 n=1 Tax=Portunus trituberculatus TaxID=210409 RepID=UPI001E1CF8AB|nr:centrosomal protein of 55 kDa-like isoform X2 [Portunus trituberculatus]
MGCGRRCGCWALSELELERARHQNTLEENARYQRHVQDLRDELSTLHSTVADLERRYSDLSARYRTTVANLDDVNDTTLRLKDHSSELSEENRRLRLTSEKLEEETRSLRGQLEEAREHAEDEHRRRVSSEMTLSRDLTLTEKQYANKLRRAHSLHDLDRQHLEHDIGRLQHALNRQKQHHRDTIRDMYCHHGRHHRHHYCLAHSIYDCYDCLHHDPMLLD